MSDWWQGVEDALSASSSEAPDPWADLADEVPMLTDAQRSFLEQVAAQPLPIRWSDDDEGLLGNGQSGHGQAGDAPG